MSWLPYAYARNRNPVKFPYQLELDGVLEAKKIMEEENGRLMERSSAVQQQEATYKRMQDSVTSTNEAKSRLAYEKGKLQVQCRRFESTIFTRYFITCGLKGLTWLVA